MALRFLARSLVASIFVVGGGDAARTDSEVRTELAQQFLARYDINLDESEAQTLVKTNGALQALGGVAMSLGIFPRLAALGLLVSLTATTLAGHAYWRYDDPAQRAQQRIQFLKNLSLAGGLLAIAVAPKRRRSAKG